MWELGLLAKGSRLKLIGFSIAGLVFARSLASFIRSYYKWCTSPLRKMPSPAKNSNFLFGSFWDIQNEPFLEPHKRWLKEFGWDKHSVPFVFYTTLFGSSAVLVMDCDVVKEIMTAPSSTNEARFPKKLNILKPLIGDGLVTLDGADWSRHRRIIQPSFQVSVLRDSLDQRVWPAVSVLVEAWKRVPGREIDVSAHLSAVTLDIIGHVAFLYDFKALDVVTAWSHDASQNELGAVEDPLISCFHKAMKPNPLRIALSLLNLGGLYERLIPAAKRMRELINQAVDKVIDDNMQDDKTSASPKSLLQLLFNARDSEDGNKALSHVELRDETKTFLLAGHETTSTWCYWACYALAKYPDIQEKVFRDVSQACPRGPVTLATVEKMAYLEAFLQEVLRMFPPVGIIARYNASEEQLGGCRIPPNTRLSIAPHLLHRHPQYWPEPDVFKPERWLVPGPIPGGRSHHFAFLPFSAGGRNCIGQRFATIEAQLIMAAVIREVRLEVAPSLRDTQLRFSTFVTMKAKPQLKICAFPRT